MKPRIVILSAFLTPFRSGAEACAEEVPLRLRDQFDFTIVTSRLRKDLPKRDILPGGIPVVRVGFGYKFDKWLYPFLAPFAARKLKPDIIHAILETYAGLTLRHCRIIVPKAKTILTLQTLNRSFMKKKIIKSAHKVTAISSALLKFAQNYRSDQVSLIPNGIDLQKINEACQWHKKIPGRILFVGRLERFKGVDMLLNAVAFLQNENVELIIAGDGSERRNLENLAEELGVKNRVRFLGYISPLDVYKEYAQADIFCGLSRSEALGNVFLEAQAAGCAVVATNVGGIPDIVSDGQTGILVKPDDAQGAADGIRRLLRDSDLGKRLTEAGKRNAEGYDWIVISKKYEGIYNSFV